MDFFMRNSNLPIQNKRNLKTYFGTILTAILTGCIISITSIYTYNFFEDEKFLTKIYNLELSSKNNGNFYLGYMISFSRKLQNAVRLLEWDSYYYKINPKECTKEQFDKFSNETRLEDLVYLCNEYDKPNSAYDLWNSFINCSTLQTTEDFYMAQDGTCNEYTYKKEDFKPQLWFRHYYYNESLKENNFGPKVTKLSSNIYDYDYFYMNMQTLKLDKGYFSKFYDSFFFTSILNYQKYQSNMLYAFEFEFINNIVKEKDKPKIPDLLIAISGLVKVIYIILFTINSLFATFSYQKYVLSYLFENENIENIAKKYAIINCKNGKFFI
jgi:hypothetical protein